MSFEGENDDLVEYLERGEFDEDDDGVGCPTLLAEVGLERLAELFDFLQTCTGHHVMVYPGQPTNARTVMWVEIMVVRSAESVG